MRRLAGLVTLFITLVLAGGCLDNVEEVPLGIDVDELAAPSGFELMIGNGKVTLSWNPVQDASKYRVYRTGDVSADPRRISETDDTSYTDTDVINGRFYYYSVSAVGASNLEGSRSETIAALPTAYSVIINGGLEYTGSRTVILTLTAPETTDLMMISNDSLLTGGQWEVFSSTRDWSIDDGDGEKFVYAVFHDIGGAYSDTVRGRINLDTYAMIESISFAPVPPYSPGATVHFTMRVDGDERSGQAWIELEGLYEDIILYDDGRGGDPVEDDGIYETDFKLPELARGLNLKVEGMFVDRVGNEAPYFEALDEISFTDPPEAVHLLGVIDSTVSSITVQWVASENDHFAYYSLYRNDSPDGMEDIPSDSLPHSRYLVQSLSSIGQTTYPDGSLTEGSTYYYRIYVVNDLDECAGSNMLIASTYDAIPEPVVLDELSAVGNDRVTLTWSENQNTDFEEYRIYRSTEPGVTEGSYLVDTVDNREITFYDDSGLDLGSNTYYYRVFVIDKSGKIARSNEVSSGS